MSHFRVKNFERFQHYKDRSPTWIKLYNELLDDYEFGKLPDASKAHLLAIWLLASRYQNRIPHDSEWVARRINATSKVDLGILERTGFIVVDQDCTKSLAEPYQDAIPEKERETEKRERREERISRKREHEWPLNFEELFWEEYPKRRGKQAAFKVLRRIQKADEVPWDRILGGLRLYRKATAKTEPQYIKDPATWLNAGCWDDEPPERKSKVFQEPAYMRPPADYYRKDRINGAEVGAEIRSNPSLGHNGADHDQEFPLSSGAILRGEVGRAGGDAPDGQEGDAGI